MSWDRVLELQQESWRLQSEARLDDASVRCQEALRLAEHAEGDVSPDVANLLNDLADIERDRQNYGFALALAERARSILDALADTFSGEAAARIRMRTLLLAGDLRCIQGEYASSECDLQMAMATAVAAFGEASDEAALTRNNLGVLYKYWGRFDEALQLYRVALGPILSVHGQISLSAATVYHNIGGILHAQREFAAALAPAWRAWNISRHILGDDDPQTMRDAVAYCAILDGLERYDESEPIYRVALTIFEQAYGVKHAEVAATLHNLAAVLTERSKYQEAERCYRRALAIKEALFGVETADVAMTLNNLGKLLTDSGRAREAVPFLVSAVATLEGQLRADHPHLAIARANLQTARARADETRSAS